MALPTPPPVTTPIPNSPFFSPPSYLTNPYYPVIVGAGLSLNPATSVLTSTGGGGAVSSVTAGAGISVTPSVGNVVVSNAGVTSLIAGAGVTLSGATGAITISASGGGGGTPATPTVEGIVYGCTDAVNFNYGLGDGILSSLTTGILNLAVGGGALATTDAGTSNTAIGIGALYSNTSGNQNVALGQQALFAGTTGGLNVAVGSQALQNTTGEANTALGNFAGNTVTSGSKNIILGHNGAPDTPVFSVTTEDNRVVMGTTAITNAYIQVAWSAVSDARDKTNVTALPVGLDFVNRLNPVSFRFKESRECDTAYGPVRYGFLAQEVLAAEGENPVIVDTEDPEKLKVTNDYMNAVLVKAIQELSAKVEALETKLASNG